MAQVYPGWPITWQDVKEDGDTCLFDALHKAGSLLKEWQNRQMSRTRSASGVSQMGRIHISQKPPIFHLLSTSRHWFVLPHFGVETQLNQSTWAYTIESNPISMWRFSKIGKGGAGGTPKSPRIAFINQPFWGYYMYGKPHFSSHVGASMRRQELACPQAAHCGPVRWQGYVLRQRAIRGGASLARSFRGKGGKHRE